MRTRAWGLLSAGMGTAVLPREASGVRRLPEPGSLHAAIFSKKPCSAGSVFAGSVAETFRCRTFPAHSRHIPGAQDSRGLLTCCLDSRCAANAAQQIW